jgi:hypothetical protein
LLFFKGLEVIKPALEVVALPALQIVDNHRLFRIF